MIPRIIRIFESAINAEAELMSKKDEEMLRKNEELDPHYRLRMELFLKRKYVEELKKMLCDPI